MSLSNCSSLKTSLSEGGFYENSLIDGVVVLASEKKEFLFDNLA